ncbi:MAG: hypothetical protein JWP26_2521 [Devosia sp.]|uniref:hypothetical protein n=1 Tax=Devosia sp. TaxID=1871048 RepID=UPI00262D0308|nr:hypothetical protein [Devosia sp.]MDB5587551.1 hypothetical protein [Devosia sp.]
MASDPDQEAKLATLLGQLANTRPDLGLELDNAGREFVPLAAIPKMELDRWLADTATLAEGIDERTAAAYLLSILVWKLGEILAALHLGGAILEIDVAVQYAVSGSGRSGGIQFHFAVSPATRHGSCQRSINQAIVDLHEPMVNALFDRTGLSRRALWRLVTDGIAGGFLERGKRSGDTDRARAAASTLLSKTDSPLHNLQWGFVEIVIAGAPAEWFRLRGGCCRLYRSVGGIYCTTCVVRQAEIEGLSVHVARGRAS